MPENREGKSVHTPLVLFVLYDDRARYMEVEDAIVLDTAESAEEAKAVDTSIYGGCIWVEYNIVEESLVDEKIRWDL